MSSPSRRSTTPPISTFLHVLLLSSCVSALAACAGKEHLTPPLYAALPAPDKDREAPPTNGRLPDDVRPVRYALSLSLSPQQKSYRGTVRIELLLTRPRESIWLHNRGPRVSQARVLRPGADALPAELESVSESGLAALRLKQPVGPGPVTLELDFEAEFGTHLSGLYRVEAGGDAYLFTQFESTSAREAFPCFDEPRFKTPFDLRVTLPRELTVVANTQVEATRELANTALREVHFRETEKLPTYLLALAVGPFDVVAAPALAPSSVRSAPVPLAGVAIKGRGADLAAALEDTPKLLAQLEDYFGIGYPYDKLDLIAVPDFAAGAMENAGAITFRDTLLLLRKDATEGQRRAMSSVNAHELAHQWFGNLVTMPWWDDVWLNESFATWMASRVIEKVHPEHKAQIAELSGVLDAMELDSQAAARQIRQPITSDHDIANAFDAITYEKGGAVLSMFERYLGADTFRAGLRLYMQRHRFGSATAQDLVAALAEAAQQKELAPAFNSFLEQPGVPLVSVETHCAQGAVSLTLQQSRYAPVGSSIERAALWQVPVCVRFASEGKVSEQCTLLGTSSARVELETKSCPSWLLPNSGAAGYYRYQLAGPALSALIKARTELSEAEQLSVANNLVATLRAGGLSAELALASLSQLSDLPSRLVLDQILETFAYVKDKLLDEAQHESYRAQVARLVKPLYARLGLFPSGVASGEEKLLRARAVRVLALEAKDAPLLAELSRLGRARLALGEHPRSAELAPELVEPALSAALRSGDASSLERAIETLVAENDGTARGRLLAAISRLDQPALSERVLALSLDPRLRVNERFAPLRGQMESRATRAFAFAWMKQHYAELVEALGEHRAPQLVGMAGDFCAEEEAEDARAFFAERAEKLRGGPRSLALALESVRLCAAFADAQRESARRYFALPVSPLAKPRAAAPKPLPTPN